MIPYEGFKEKYYPQKKQWRSFTQVEIDSIGTHLHQDVIDFLRIEGLSSYLHHFLWTALPVDFHDILSAWGMKGNQCHAFLRTAFGACIFFYRDAYYYLDPLEGRRISLGDDFYFVLNYMIRSETILEEGFYLHYFNHIKADPDLLHPDEIFGFVPALPLGGSVDTSKVEIVKMKEHLHFLSQLFDGKAAIIR